MVAITVKGPTVAQTMCPDQRESLNTAKEQGITKDWEVIVIQSAVCQGFRFQKRSTTLCAFVCKEQQPLFLDALITQRSVCENVTRCRGVFNLSLVLKPLSLYSLKLKRRTALLHGFDPLVVEMYLCNKRFLSANVDVTNCDVCCIIQTSM